MMIEGKIDTLPPGLLDADLDDPVNRLVLADALEEAGACAELLRKKAPLPGMHQPDANYTNCWVWLMACRGQVFPGACLPQRVFSRLRGHLVDERTDPPPMRLHMRQKGYVTPGQAWRALAEALMKMPRPRQHP